MGTLPIQGIFTYGVSEIRKGFDFKVEICYFLT
jgi:hypothetical protein